MLERDYESEFVMRTRLLEKVMSHLDQPCKTKNEEKLAMATFFKGEMGPTSLVCKLMKVRWCVEVVCVYVWWREAQAQVCCTERTVG